MLKKIYSIFKRYLGKSTVYDAITATKTVKIKGVKFIIKKIDVLNFLDGSNIMQQAFDTYKMEKDKSTSEINSKKLRQYLSEVIVAGCVDPELTFKQEGPGMFVDLMFVEYEMVMKLYEEIMAFTYGNKKKA